MLSSNKPNASRLVFAIGANMYTQLGIDNAFRSHVSCLTQSNISNLSDSITNINSGWKYTIFANNEQHKYWSCGYNQYGQCAVDNNLIKSELKKISFFNYNHIKINKVCTNQAGYATFWITKNNELYGNGCAEDFCLGLNVINKCIINPLHIELYGVKDVKCSNTFSIALLISIKNPEKIINCWCNSLNIQIPMDIHQIIKYYLSMNCVYSTGYSKYGGHGHGAKKCKIWTEIDYFKDKYIKLVQVGIYHSVFLGFDNDLYVCGGNKFGQLGMSMNMDNTKNRIMENTYFKDNGIIVKDIKCGSHHTIIMDETGNIYSFGANDLGQCGTGNKRKCELKPILIDSLKKYKVIEIGCGALHSYAKTDCSKHFLWGDNRYSQCIAVDNYKSRVLKPLCINDAIMIQTGYKNIVKVCLGKNNTFVILTE